MEDRPRLVSGVIAQSDRMTVQREWAFKNATIRSVAFPEMDFRSAPASIDVAVRTQERLCLKSGQSFRIRPTSIAPVAWWGQARLSISPKPYHPARPLCVCQISSFAFNNHVLKGVGDPEVQRGEIPNLCFTIPDQFYDASWEGLYKDTIKGKAGISGSLEFMSKDGASTIATMDFWDAGISAVRPTKQLRGPVRVTEVQMFIERIRFR
jgi:hypothetical protein